MQEVQDFLVTLLQTVFVTVVPVISAYVIKMLKTWMEQKETQISSTKTRAYLDELTEAVSSSVAYISQSYIKELKRSGNLNAETRAIALEKAKETAINSLTTSAKDFFDKNHDNLSTLVETKVEEAVKTQLGK